MKKQDNTRTFLKKSDLGCANKLAVQIVPFNPLVDGLVGTNKLSKSSKEVLRKNNHFDLELKNLIKE